MLFIIFFFPGFQLPLGALGLFFLHFLLVLFVLLNFLLSVLFHMLLFLVKLLALFLLVSLVGTVVSGGSAFCKEESAGQSQAGDGCDDECV